MAQSYEKNAHNERFAPRIIGIFVVLTPLAQAAGALTAQAVGDLGNLLSASFALGIFHRSVKI